MGRERRVIVLQWETVMIQPEVWGRVGMAASSCAWEVTAVPPA